jgi:hypothetical protein
MPTVASVVDAGNGLVNDDGSTERKFRVATGVEPGCTVETNGEDGFDTDWLSSLTVFPTSRVAPSLMRVSSSDLECGCG